MEGRRDSLRSLFPRLREMVARLHPGREHIVYSEDEFNHFVSEYDPAWEETFIVRRKNYGRLRNRATHRWCIAALGSRMVQHRI